MYTICDEKLQIKYDETVGKIFGFYLCINIVNLFIKQTEIITVNHLSVILGLVYIVYMYKRYRNISAITNVGNLIVAEAIFIVLLMGTCFIYYDSRGAILARCIHTIMFCIPLYVLTKKVRNIKRFTDQTVFPSVVTLVLGICIFFYFRFHPVSYPYNMPLGYALVYPACLFWCKRKSFKYLSCFFLTFLVIFLIGSRGPLLCIGILLITSYFFMGNMRKKVQMKVLIVILIVPILAFFNDILNFFSIILNNANIESRSLRMILDGGITSDAGRWDVWFNAVEIINKHPLLGYGISGDIPAFGGYPHNFFLELIMHFGYIIGGVLGLYCLIVVVHNFIRKKDSDRECLMIFVSCGFVPLMLSGTYLQTPIMWILIGLSTTRKINFRVSIGKIITIENKVFDSRKSSL